MSMGRKLLYAGYGANREPEMMEALIGSEPKDLGAVALLSVELCVQTLDQVPQTSLSPDLPSPRSVLEASWRDIKFQTYTIRRKLGSEVAGRLFEITPVQRAVIAEWEMIELGWFKRMPVFVRGSGMSLPVAETEGLGTNQEAARAVDQVAYEPYLNGKTQTLIRAEAVRNDFYARLRQGS